MADGSRRTAGEVHPRARSSHRTDTPATGIVGAEARRQFLGEYQMGRGVFRVDFEEGDFVLTTPRGGKIR
jgi:hypothetical protein